jgi:hypothetical protein
MSENKCLGYTLSVAGHTIKVNKCGNMAQLREQESRLAALEAENAALHSRLEFTSCQKADVEAQVLELEEQNAALREAVAVSKKNEYRGMTRELIAVVRQILRDIPDPMTNEGYCMNCQSRLREAIERMDITYAALEAAGLVENTDGTD